MPARSLIVKVLGCQLGKEMSFVLVVIRGPRAANRLTIIMSRAIWIVLPILLNLK